MLRRLLSGSRAASQPDPWREPLWPTAPVNVSMPRRVFAASICAAKSVTWLARGGNLTSNAMAARWDWLHQSQLNKPRSSRKPINATMPGEHLIPTAMDVPPYRSIIGESQSDAEGAE